MEHGAVTHCTHCPSQSQPQSVPSMLPLVDMMADGTALHNDCFATGYWGKVSLAELSGSLTCNNEKKWKGEVFHGNGALLN